MFDSMYVVTFRVGGKKSRGILDQDAACDNPGDVASVSLTRESRCGNDREPIFEVAMKIGELFDDRRKSKGQVGSLSTNKMLRREDDGAQQIRRSFGVSSSRSSTSAKLVLGVSHQVQVDRSRGACQ